MNKEKSNLGYSRTVSMSNTFGKKIKTNVSTNILGTNSRLNSPRYIIDNVFNDLKILKNIEIAKRRRFYNSMCYIFPRNLMKKLIFNFYEESYNILIAFGKSTILFPHTIEIRILLLMPKKNEHIISLMFKNNKRFKIFEPMKILGLVLRIKEKDQPLKIPNISLIVVLR